MGDPEEPDEPAGRKPCVPGSRVRRMHRGSCPGSHRVPGVEVESQQHRDEHRGHHQAVGQPRERAHGDDPGPAGEQETMSPTAQPMHIGMHISKK